MCRIAGASVSFAMMVSRVNLHGKMNDGLDGCNVVSSQ